jgi:hypothetical protein
MSISRGIAVFLLSSLFVFSLFMSITSYTLGDLLQKENLKDFIETGIAPDIIENQCNESCSNDIERQNCLDDCLDDMGNSTSKTISSVIDNVYETEFYGFSIEQVTSLLKEFFLFVILAAISGVAILFVSEEPFSILGRNVISVSITLFITAFSPNFILSLSNVPVNSMFSGYISQGLEQQTLFAIILLVIAIVFLVADYLIKRKKTGKEETKK